MHDPAPREWVRLTQPIRTPVLRRGAVGVVRRVWVTWPRLYEVEFRNPGELFHVRTLIRAEHPEAIGGATSEAPGRMRGATP